jgi:hypothetical protein
MVNIQALKQRFFNTEYLAAKRFTVSIFLISLSCFSFFYYVDHFFKIQKGLHAPEVLIVTMYWFRLAAGTHYPQWLEMIIIILVAAFCYLAFKLDMTTEKKIIFTSSIFFGMIIAYLLTLPTFIINELSMLPCVLTSPLLQGFLFLVLDKNDYCRSKSIYDLFYGLIFYFLGIGFICGLVPAITMLSVCMVQMAIFLLIIEGYCRLRGETIFV